MSTAPSFDFQKLNAELEQILEELQSESMDIDKAINLYERGMYIVEQLQNYLKEAKNKVTKIKHKFDK